MEDHRSTARRCIRVPAGLPGTSRILVAGRDDVWGSSDDGGTWYPYVRNLGITVNRTVAADPNVPGRAYVGGYDWTFYYATDGLRHVTQTFPPMQPSNVF